MLAVTTGLVDKLSKINGVMVTVSFHHSLMLVSDWTHLVLPQTELLIPVNVFAHQIIHQITSLVVDLVWMLIINANTIPTLLMLLIQMLTNYSQILFLDGGYHSLLKLVPLLVLLKPSVKITAQVTIATVSVCQFDQ